jgi:iron complex transport system permease protein
MLSGIATFLISMSSTEALHGIVWWLLGSLQVFSIRLIALIGISVTAGIIVCWIFSRDLNAISLGEEEAMHLGIELEKIKIIIIVSCSLITASIVSACGIIGFVGLIIPHISRLLVGQNHKTLIPIVSIMGALFMVCCDAISRSIITDADIPIGVITALIGGPLLITLLRKNYGAR